MDGIIIKISWEYFFGIMGVLLGIAWYSNGRFTKLETSMEWVKDALKEIKVSNSNEKNPVFATNSPVALTPKGTELLDASGLKKYIDSHKKELMKLCDGKESINPYEVQEHIFKVFNASVFEEKFYDQLKRFAFEQGADIELIKRVGAIYFRDIVLAEFDMKGEDIDKHAG